MRRLFLLFCISLLVQVAFAQNKEVSGVVLSAEDNEPIIGASVVVDGNTTVGVATNVKGEFKFSLPASAKRLKVSYTGYKTVVVNITSGKMKIVLESDSEMLDDIVVTAYGSAKKTSLVGSQANINTKALAEKPISNVSKALLGEVAGVQSLTGSGQPGAGASIVIRGFGSVNASSAPLIVVDGSPYNGSIADINPSDVKSISVLKDAASTALYGSSAGNGVLMITTKDGSFGGKEAKPTFTFSMNHGASVRGRDYYETVGVDDYMHLVWLQYFNRDLYETKMSKEQANLVANSEIPGDIRYNSLEVPYLPYTGIKTGVGFDNQGNAFTVSNGYDGSIKSLPLIFSGVDENLRPIRNKEITGINVGDTDWDKHFYRVGVRSEYNLSSSYSNKSLKSFLSMGYLNEDGFAINTGFKRFTLRSNLSYNINKYLELGANVSYIKSEQQAPFIMGGYNANGFSFASMIAPIYPVYLMDANHKPILDSEGKQVFDHSETRPFRGRFNTVELSDLDLSVTDRNAVSTRVFSTFHLYDGLDFTLNLSHDESLNVVQRRMNHIMGDQKGIGMLEKSSRKYQTTTFNQLLKYVKSFGNNNFDFLLGHESYVYRYNGFFANKTNAAIHGLDEFANYTKMSEIGSGFVDYRKEGYFGRINYDYDGRYNASLSYRRDGTSRLAKDRRWGNFWSAGFGWNISRESFMKDISWVNNLRLRLSVGQTGNDMFLNEKGTAEVYWPYKTLYGLGNKNYNINGVQISNLGNPELLWEGQTSYDAALDYAFLNNRIRGSVEFFNKESDNLIFGYSLPISTGLSSIFKNLGKVRNYGVEFDIKADAIRMKNFTWTLGLNATTYKNVVVSLPEDNRKDGIEVGSFKYMEGKSLYDYYLKTWKGVDPKTGNSIYVLDREKDKQGKAMIEKTGEYSNYTYDASVAKKEYAGSSIPKVYGGFSTSFNIYGVDLSAQFAYQLGGKVYDSGYAALMGPVTAGGRTFHVDALSSWRKPGDSTDIPKIALGETAKYNYAGSTQFLVSSNALMLKSMTIGYQLPDRFAKKMYLSGIRFSLSGENLFLWSARKGLNPMGSFGHMDSYREYDYAKNVTFNITLNM